MQGLTIAPRSLLSYASTDTHRAAMTGNGQLPVGYAGEDLDIEFRKEHTFENGAVYKG